MLFYLQSIKLQFFGDGICYKMIKNKSEKDRHFKLNDSVNLVGRQDKKKFAIEEPKMITSKYLAEAFFHNQQGHTDYRKS